MFKTISAATAFALILCACTSNAEAEGKQLAKEYCEAMKTAMSDPSRAMALGSEWGAKSQTSAQKYASDPAKMAEHLKGYQTGSMDCLR